MPSAAGRDEAGHVQRIGRHDQFAGRNRPGRPRPVREHLDAQAIGVRQIESLAHQMIGGAGVGADSAQVREQLPQ